MRKARQANPEKFDEEKTWYRRHTNAHTPEQWGTPEEEWAAEKEAVAEKRLRDPQPEDVGLGEGAFSNIFGSGEEEDEEDDGEDY